MGIHWSSEVGPHILQHQGLTPGDLRGECCQDHGCVRVDVRLCAVFRQQVPLEDPVQRYEEDENYDPGLLAWFHEYGP